MIWAPTKRIEVKVEQVAFVYIGKQSVNEIQTYIYSRSHRIAMIFFKYISNKIMI